MLLKALCTRGHRSVCCTEFIRVTWVPVSTVSCAGGNCKQVYGRQGVVMQLDCWREV